MVFFYYLKNVKLFIAFFNIFGLYILLFDLVINIIFFTKVFF